MADLMQFERSGQSNATVAYALLVQNVFTRKLFAVPMAEKETANVIRALETVFFFCFCRQRRAGVTTLDPWPILG